ncbi:TPA: hypothetical protein RJD49_001642 [Legionella pneumophila]|nr:hypothetical protein [Legionella pneumophila]HDV5807100.1 hypothetical protein [Legionella pneumophila]
MIPFDLEKINWKVSNNHYNTNTLLSLLGYFTQADETNFKMSLELICKYVEKMPTSAPNVLHLFSEQFGFDRYSHFQNYSKQYFLIDTLIEYTENGENLLFSKLFISLCEKYLHTRFDDTDSQGNSVTFHQCKLLAIPPLLDLRQKIWNHLFKLFNRAGLTSDVINLLNSYSKSNYYLDVQEIVEYDSQQLIPFILSVFDPHNFQHCLIAQQYAKLVFQLKLNVDVKTLSKKFNCKPYQIYELLSLNYADHEDSLDWKAFEEYKRVEIDKYTLQYTFEEYEKLLEMGQEILNQTEDNHERYQLVEGFLQIFNTLADRDTDLYIKVIKYYLSKGEQFKLHNPILLVRKLIDAMGFKNTVKFIDKQNFQTKLHWLFACYQVLPDKQIQAEHIANLYKLYEKAVFGEVPRDFGYLLNYLEKDNLIIVNITKILLDKALIDKNFGYCFSLLFNPFAKVNNLLESLFKGNESILKQAYIAHERVESHADFDGKSLNLIMNMDPNFLLEYVDYIYSDNEYYNNYNKSRDYHFLWKRDNNKELMTSVIAKILSYGTDKNYRFNEFLKQLFFIDKARSDLVDIKEKQDCFLKTTIKNCSHNIDIMSLIFKSIAHFEVERRSILIAYFLTQNQDIESFKTLPLEPNSWGWQGSAVPIIAGRIAYWQNLLPYCNSINLLAHRQYIEDRIQELLRHLEAEKKSDFIND